MSRAVLGMDWRAEDVIRVCATSKCVRCGRRGSRVSNVEDGRIVHSCRERRVIGNTAGRDGEDKVTANASLKEAEEQAQKSNACRRGREQKRVVRTSELTSLSMCSWARNSWRFGVRVRHRRIVDGIRLRVSARSRAVMPAQVGLKWEKSMRRTIVPNAG